MGRVISKEVVDYHDYRWCKPCFDDVELFAMLSLEIMQAGLNWGLILKKEPAIRRAFNFFDVKVVASYNLEKVKNLMTNKNIIRNSKKIYAIIKNAGAFLNVQQCFGTFSNYIWSFTNGQSIDHKLKNFDELPVYNEFSKKVSLCLKNFGFSFIWPTVVYSYLQAIGVFNDHCVNCSFR